MSKTKTLVQLLKAAGASDPFANPLTGYHAAKATVNALRCQHPQVTLSKAREALRRYNVRVEYVNALLTVSTFNRSHIWCETGRLIET